MSILFDIGGTNFRCYFDDEQQFITIKKEERESDIMKQMKKCLEELEFKGELNFNKIKVSIAGIVDNYTIFGCSNAGLNDGTKLIESYKNINVKYLNDGDAFILGEVLYNNLDIKNNNILGLIFGTGVGCGLIINGELVRNAEIHPYIESFMKENNLNEKNIDLVTDFIAESLSKKIKLLNLDIIIFNGYINQFSNFLEKIIIKLDIGDYHYNKLNIFVSNSKNSILLGLRNFL